MSQQSNNQNTSARSAVPKANRVTYSSPAGGSAHSSSYSLPPPTRGPSQSPRQSSLQKPVGTNHISGTPHLFGGQRTRGSQRTSVHLGFLVCGRDFSSHFFHQKISQIITMWHQTFSQPHNPLVCIQWWHQTFSQPHNPPVGIQGCHQTSQPHNILVGIQGCHPQVPALIRLLMRDPLPPPQRAQ